MSKKIILRLVEEKDYLVLAGFLQTMTRDVLKSDLWLDRFQLWWHVNPAADNNVPKGWVLCDENAEIGGFIGNIAVKYLLNGHEQIVYAATSWYVRDDFRSASIQLIRAFKKQGAPLLDTTPIGNVVVILNKLGFSGLVKPWMQQDGVYPLDLKLFSKFICGKVASKVKLPFFAKIGSLILFAGLKACFLFKQRNSDSGINIKTISSFNIHYDKLWDELKSTSAIMAVRDSVALNWFFFGTKNIAKTRAVIEIRRGEQLLGYMAFKIVKSIAGDREYLYMEMVDCLLSDFVQCDADKMLDSVLVYIRKQYPDIVCLRMNAFYEFLDKPMSKAGFFMIKGTSRFMHSKFPENMDFYATALDGDRPFFP